MTEDGARLDALERTIERLAQELAAAQRALGELRSETPAAAPTDPDAELRAILRAPPSRPAPREVEPREANHDGGLENIIGRYGALALAVLTIVMGAGALVSWAITHGLLGPWVRVSLGAVLALVIASTGWWLRARGSRGFGNALLALSLAVIDVVAWGAGPRLGLVKPWLSLGFVDLASLALAALAVVENEELLFGAGLGGALIAPFVMATGVPHHGILALYGLMVLAVAVRTIGSRAWWSSVAIVVVGTVVYAAGADGFTSGPLWVNREFAATFAASIAVIALIWERVPSRPWIALAAVTTAGFATHRADVSAAPTIDTLMAAPYVPLCALAGTLLFFAIVRAIDEREQSTAWNLAVVAVPGIFLIDALSPFNAVAGFVPESVVLTWALAYGLFALAENGRRRGILITLAAALVFACGYLELRRAFRADVLTFLTIAYLATWGVGTIYIGRVRSNSGLRQIGLSLAVVAALYAISAASDVQLIGLRVGSYLLVGAFLLGVGWWYRGEQPAER
jgi:uncharacterized membrane protein